jgi:hypothetical protein
LNGSIKPPGGENGRDGEASTFLAEGGPFEGLVGRLLQVGSQKPYFSSTAECFFRLFDDGENSLGC